MTTQHFPERTRTWVERRFASPAILLTTATLSLSNNAIAEDTLSKKNESTSVNTSSNPQPEMTVYGRALSLYRAQESSLGTKTLTPIEKTPQTIQVMTHQLIEDQGARQITDLYRSISGVSQYNYSYVTFRGFRQDDVLYDGVRGDPYQGLFVPQLFHIERVEVLKGPSAALLGSGDPGGVINYVTKKPTYNTERHVSVKAGNQDFTNGLLELSGPVNHDQSQRYRLGLYQDHENPDRKNTDIRNRIIDLGYAWDLSDDTTLSGQYLHVVQHYGGGRIRGIPTDDAGNFLADITWNANDASDYLSLDANVFQTRLDHRLNDWLSTNLTLRYYDNKDVQKYHEARALSDTNRDGIDDFVTRQYRDQLRRNKSGSITSNWIAELDDHTILWGADYYRLDNAFTYFRANASDGVSGRRLSDPDYSEDDVSTYQMTLNTHQKTEEERYGAFLQDQWSVTEAWDVLGGVRFDRYHDQINDIKNDDSDSHTGSGWSYRLGSTYQINKQLHPYAVVATGFVPQAASSQTTDNGGPFDPEESFNYETGLRSYWFENRLNLNLAFYHITKKNVLQTDPDDSRKQVAYGKVRSQGVEVDMLMDLTEEWSANLSYAYNDTAVKQAYDGISRTVGRRFANAPHQQLGLWTRYAFPTLNSTLGFGGEYKSEQFNQNGQRVKPYTIYDASWQTKWDDFTVQLNMKNLFDKAYAVSGFTKATGHFIGERRRIYLNVDYAF